MRQHILHRFQGMIVGLFILLLVTACAGVAGTTQTYTGTVVSVDPTHHSVVLSVNGHQQTIGGLSDQEVATLQAQINKVYTLYTTGTGSTVTISPDSTPVAGTPETQPTSGTTSTAFQPGSIQFIGTVSSSSSSSVTVSTPDSNSLSVRIIAGQTDLSKFNGSAPAVQQLIKVDATANQDGSFTATKLDITDQGDVAKQSIVDYHGVTTSAVGADRIIHFTVGTKAYSFAIAQNADLGDFGGNAQAIQANQAVKVTVQFSGSTGSVLKAGLSNGSG